MRVAMVHGYFLHDSGSATDVRELTRALVHEGHDVTLVCQERRPDLYDFIDSVYVLNEGNDSIGPARGRRPRRYAGSCRLVRPNLDGRLLVYVEGPFPGFTQGHVRTFQDAPDDWIDSYVEANVRALRAVFGEWLPDVAIAHHAVMQPWIVRRALGESAPYVVALHGSELNFSIRKDPRLVPYALEGLAGAAAVIAVSEPNAVDVMGWAREHGLDISRKTRVIPPGVSALFTPAPSRRAAVDRVLEEFQLPDGFDLQAEDDILVFAGRLLYTKGVQHAVAALPQITRLRPRARLLVAGAGPALGSLEELAVLLGAGETDRARRLAHDESTLASPVEFGEVVSESSGASTARVTFLGHLRPERLAAVFAAADVAIAPSVFPEALGLVNVEALSAGALPISTYESGTVSLVDAISDMLDDPALRALVPDGGSLTDGLARLVVHTLERYPTKDPEFRSRLHELALDRFATWTDAANAYLELAAGSLPV